MKSFQEFQLWHLILSTLSSLINKHARLPFLEIFSGILSIFHVINEKSFHHTNIQIKKSFPIMKNFILVILLLGTSEQLQQIKHRIFNQSINSFSKFLFSKSFSILLEIRQIFYHWHDLITDFWKAFF